MNIHELFTFMLPRGESVVKLACRNQGIVLGGGHHASMPRVKTWQRHDAIDARSSVKLVTHHSESEVQ